MSLISDDFRTSQRAKDFDGERGSLRKIVELLARNQLPNSITVLSKQTAANGKAWTRLDAAAGFRISGQNGTGTSLTFRRNGTNTADVAATLTTACAGANNDLDFTAKAAGAQGNNITVAYVVAGNNTPLTVAVVGTAITVNVATGAGGAATSTSAQVKAAVDASVAAAALVSVANTAANDGTGVVAAFGAANLANGADTVVPTIAVASGAAIDIPCVSNAQEWEVKRTDDSNTQVTLKAFLHAST